MSTAWKALELRICRALGGRRGGPTGSNTSDCVNVPFAVEIKRSSRPGPPVLSKWILQARQQSKRERKPWLVVVAGHNDRRPIIAMDFWAFAQIAQEAGRIPTPIEEPPSDDPLEGVQSTPNLRMGGYVMTETPTEPQPTEPQPPPEPPEPAPPQDEL